LMASAQADVDVDADKAALKPEVSGMAGEPVAEEDVPEATEEPDVVAVAEPKDLPTDPETPEETTKVLDGPVDAVSPSPVAKVPESAVEAEVEMEEAPAESGRSELAEEPQTGTTAEESAQAPAETCPAELEEEEQAPAPTTPEENAQVEASGQGEEAEGKRRGPHLLPNFERRGLRLWNFAWNPASAELDGKVLTLFTPSEHSPVVAGSVELGPGFYIERTSETRWVVHPPRGAYDDTLQFEWAASSVDIAEEWIDLLGACCRGEMQASKIFSLRPSVGTWLGYVIPDAPLPEDSLVESVEQGQVESWADNTAWHADFTEEPSLEVSVAASSTFRLAPPPLPSSSMVLGRSSSEELHPVVITSLVDDELRAAAAAAAAEARPVDRCQGSFMEGDAHSLLLNSEQEGRDVESSRTPPGTTARDDFDSASENEDVARGEGVPPVTSDRRERQEASRVPAAPQNVQARGSLEYSNSGDMSANNNWSDASWPRSALAAFGDSYPEDSEAPRDRPAATTLGAPKASESDIDRVARCLDAFFGNEETWDKVGAIACTPKFRKTAEHFKLLRQQQFQVNVPKGYPGVQYRWSKHLHDRCHNFAIQGTIVEGYLEDDGEWLRCEGADGAAFLPTKVKGLTVLVPQPGKLTVL